MGWALFLVWVARSVTVTELEVPSHGRSGPQRSRPEPSLVYSTVPQSDSTTVGTG